MGAEAGAGRRARAFGGVCGIRVGKHVGKGCAAEHLLDAGGRVIQPAVQRAEMVAVRGQSERTCRDPPRRLDRRNDVEQGDPRRVAAEDEAPVEPAL
jgi:hypothetical protein